MRKIIALTRNLRKLDQARKVLSEEDYVNPTMALVYGDTGLGKSTAIAWFGEQLRSTKYSMLPIELSDSWTQVTLLKEMVAGIGYEPHHARYENEKIIVQQVIARQIVICIDEANYLFADGGKMLNTLHDIWNKAQMPIFLFGRDGIERRITKKKHIDRRVTQRIEFLPLDLEDCQKVFDDLCEVKVAPCLNKKVHDWAKGSIAFVKCAIVEIERLAKNNGLEVVDVVAWGDRSFWRER